MPRTTTKYKLFATNLHDDLPVPKAGYTDELCIKLYQSLEVALRLRKSSRGETGDLDLRSGEIMTGIDLKHRFLPRRTL